MPIEDWVDCCEPPEPPNATCKFCGAEDLEWVHTGVRWVLVTETGRRHQCKALRRPTADEDFDVVPADER